MIRIEAIEWSRQRGGPCPDRQGFRLLWRRHLGLSAARLLGWLWRGGFALRRPARRQIEQQAASHFRAVVPVFLEFAEPDIGGGVDHCVKLGARKITVVPYFLSAGAHVTRDIPAQLEIARRRYPGVDLNLTSHFGATQRIPEFIIECATLTREQGAGRL